MITRKASLACSRPLLSMLDRVDIARRATQAGQIRRGDLKNVPSLDLRHGDEIACIRHHNNKWSCGIPFIQTILERRVVSTRSRSRESSQMQGQSGRGAMIGWGERGDLCGSFLLEQQKSVSKPWKPHRQNRAGAGFWRRWTLLCRQQAASLCHAASTPITHYASRYTARLCTARLPYDNTQIIATTTHASHHCLESGAPSLAGIENT